MLYNAYLPFNYSFIIDSHVFPCDSTAPREIFELFSKASIDISYSNRMNTPSLVFGGAVLSHWGKGSFEFWKNYYFWILKHNTRDDQGPMRITSQSKWGKHINMD